MGLNESPPSSLSFSIVAHEGIENSFGQGDERQLAVDLRHPPSQLCVLDFVVGQLGHLAQADWGVDSVRLRTAYRVGGGDDPVAVGPA